MAWGWVVPVGGLAVQPASFAFLGLGSNHEAATLQAKGPLATQCSGGLVSLSGHFVATNTFPLWVTGQVSKGACWLVVGFVWGCAVCVTA